MYGFNIICLKFVFGLKNANRLHILCWLALHFALNSQKYNKKNFLILLSYFFYTH